MFSVNGKQKRKARTSLYEAEIIDVNIIKDEKIWTITQTSIYWLKHSIGFIIIVTSSLYCILLGRMGKGLQCYEFESDSTV